MGKQALLCKILSYFWLFSSRSSFNLDYCLTTI